MAKSKIWEPVVGCTKIKESCRFCESERIHNRRFKAMINGTPMPKQYAKPFSTIQCISDRLEQPLHWKKPKRIFVNSMSDTFNEAVSFNFIDAIWETIYKCSWHKFLLLTKRPERALEYQNRYVDGMFKQNIWFPNIWVGISVSTQKDYDEMMPIFKKITALNKFISIEPMLEQINLSEHIDCLKWIILGAESGSNRRPFETKWAGYVLAECHINNIPFFYKQGRDVNNKVIHMPELNGKIYAEYPEGLK